MLADVDKILNLLATCADVDELNDAGETALARAVADGNFEVARSLVESGAADVNIRRRTDDASPLWIAANDGNVDLVRLLLSAQADVSAVNCHGRTPLDAAVAGVAGNCWRCVLLLIDAGAEVDRLWPKGATPLTFAVYNGQLDVASTLVSAGADVDLPTRNGDSPLLVAARKNHQEIFKLLLDAQADKGGRQLAPTLIEAAGKGQQETLELLLRGGADPNCEGNDGTTPLLAAAYGGQPMAAKLLIDAGADCNWQDEFGCSPIYIAAQNAHHLILQLLIDAGADVDRRTLKEETPLLAASHRGHLRPVQALELAMADLDAQDKRGTTALLGASSGGHQAVVDSLLRGLADPKLAQAQGASPLYFAAQNGHAETLRSLLTVGADANQLTRCGQPPIYAAARIGKASVASALISAGADVDCQMIGRSPPLWIAAQHGNKEVVQLLLDAQADCDAVGKDNLTPSDVAAQHGFWRVVDLLKQHGASSPSRRSRFSSICALGCVDETLEFLLQHDANQSADEFLTRRAPWNSLAVECLGLVQALKPLLPLLDEADRQLNDEELSMSLHSKLLLAGFCRSRAVLQASAAGVLEEILHSRWKGSERIFVVGSFSEGWGNSLRQLNGRTDPDSDIDVTHFFKANELHLRDTCECKNANPSLIVDYKNGHVKWMSGTSNPASAHRDSMLRPAVDYVRVFKCCCYPEIQILADNVSTCIPTHLLQILKEQVKSSSCHLATASPPGEKSDSLRVSTTFLERQLMRSFTDVQGQLFIVLKYLIKKVIAKQIAGLKTYHAKTLTFYMLDETPQADWCPKNLIRLVRRALQMLVENLTRRDAQSNECMRHFFMREAIVYLKGVGSKGAVSRQAVAKVVAGVLDSLPLLLSRFKQSLKPLDKSESFHFHPFLILPDVDIPKSQLEQIGQKPGGSKVDYCDVYDLVTSLMRRLSTDEFQQQSLMDDVERLPDCATSARECLRAAILLKFNRKSKALDVLRRAAGHCVSDGVSGASDEEATKATVWQSLLTADSAWKFFLHFDEPLKLPFLPGYMSDAFPIQMRNYVTYFYVNFDAMLRAFRLQLLGQEASDRAWFRRVSESDSADPQELLVMLNHCHNSDLIVRAIQLNHRMMDEDMLLHNRVNEILANPILRVRACTRTLENVKEAVKAKASRIPSSADESTLRLQALSSFYEKLYAACNMKGPK